MNIFLKRFEELAIKLRGRYKSDLFFHTVVDVGALSTGFIAVCIAIVVVSLVSQKVDWYFFIFLLVLSLVTTVLFARLMLRPVRDTLRYQKLFISNIAHELRTPLSTIKTTTEVALLDDTLSVASKKIYAEILGELDRISNIINNLLSLSTLTRPERIEFENVDLGPIVDDVEKELSELARERGVQMVVKKDAYRIVWGNRVALEQIVMNLIKNALMFTPVGSGGVVSVAVKPDGDAVTFSVSDTGIGISQNDLFHIFEPFYRVETSRARTIKKTGSGLGLSIVNELVKVQHGKIHIQSMPQSGTTVSVSFPAGIETHVQGKILRERHKGSEISVDFSRNTI